MKMHIPGILDEEQFIIVLEMCSVSSDDIIHALRCYLVDGEPEPIAALLVDFSNFKRALKRINRVMELTEKYNDLKMGKIKHAKK